jgi:hypothetical protein
MTGFAVESPVTTCHDIVAIRETWIIEALHAVLQRDASTVVVGMDARSVECGIEAL